ARRGRVLQALQVRLQRLLCLGGLGLDAAKRLQQIGLAALALGLGALRVPGRLGEPAAQQLTLRRAERAVERLAARDRLVQPALQALLGRTAQEVARELLVAARLAALQLLQLRGAQLG